MKKLAEMNEVELRACAEARVQEIKDAVAKVVAARLALSTVLWPGESKPIEPRAEPMRYEVLDDVRKTPAEIVRYAIITSGNLGGEVVRLVLPDGSCREDEITRALLEQCDSCGDRVFWGDDARWRVALVVKGFGRDGE